MTAEKRTKIAEFFSTERTRMISFVRKLLDDTADRDGEDIVHDVMLKIFDASDITAPIENLSAYIYTSLRNRITDILRKKKDAISLDQPAYNESNLSMKDLLQDVRYDTATEVEKNEIREGLFNAIDSLKEDERDLIMLTEFESWSFREVSEETGVPLGTLLSKKSRALKKIKQVLESNETLGGI